MGFIARFLGVVTKQERRGIRLDEAEPWRVSPTKDVERFVRALPLLVPEGSIAYFEGTGESHVANYLAHVSLPAAQIQVAIGTIWPRPDYYHVPVSQESMEALAAFLDKEPAGYFCTHCHVYRDGAILVEWHDAFMDDPMYVSRAISEDFVREFANRLGSTLSSARQ
jgi:hypothetical protein